MEGFVKFLGLAKPYVIVIFMRFGYAGMTILAKSALDKGMSQHVFVVYRHVLATLLIAPFAIVFDRRTRPKMTFSVFWKIVMLGLLEPVIDQNLFFSGMKLTTATFTATMSNILPASSFLMAWACRLEKVDIWKRESQAKMIGTIVTVGGAMIMTFTRGPMLSLPWTKPNQPTASSTAAPPNHQSSLKGSLMIVIGCICWSAFMSLQAITLKTYPADLSLTALICLVGTIGGSGVALVMERGNPAAWALHFDTQLLAVVYTGIICSGVAYYIQGIAMQIKGPVFVTAFSPLTMVVVAIASSFILSEIMLLGRIIGAVVIIIGLYMVLWGKSKDQISVVQSGCDHITHSAQKMTENDCASMTMVQSNEGVVVVNIAKEETN